MNVRVPVIAAGLLAVGSSGLAATLEISDEVSHALSSDVFGQFLERPSWGGERGPEGVCDDQGKLSPEIEKYLADLRAPVVRFPFGTDGDYVDWQDLIDLPGRAERPSTTGHTGEKVTNRLGLREYFELARRMGWRTILVTNLRDALYRKKPLADAAAHATALVEYARDPSGQRGMVFMAPKT